VKKIKVISISALIIVIVCFLVINKILAVKEKNRQNLSQNESSQGQVVTAEAHVVKIKTLDNEIRTIGTIRANEEVELRSEVLKKVTGIYFKEGTFVSKGKVLFKLDDADLLAKLRRQEIEQKLAISKRDREKALIDKGLATPASFEELENAVDKIDADIAITRVDISKTRIFAPFSGIIGLRNVSIGSYVDPDIVLAVIQDISKLKVDFSIPEKYITSFSTGQKILFRVEGIEGEFEADVYASEPKIENNTRSLILRALTSNPSRKLMPGNFANVTLKLFDISNAIMIPTQAVIPQLKGQSVFIYRNGTAKSVDVQTGLRTEESIQITSGLNEGDTVITTNMLRLKPDAKVKLTKLD
jgi:membrane fusion protein (multidrug efflux system)